MHFYSIPLLVSLVSVFISLVLGLGYLVDPKPRRIPLEIIEKLPPNLRHLSFKELQSLPIGYLKKKFGDSIANDCPLTNLLPCNGIPIDATMAQSVKANSPFHLSWQVQRRVEATCRVTLICANRKVNKILMEGPCGHQLGLQNANVMMPLEVSDCQLGECVLQWSMETRSRALYVGCIDIFAKPCNSSTITTTSCSITTETSCSFCSITTFTTPLPSSSSTLVTTELPTLIPTISESSTLIPSTIIVPTTETVPTTLTFVETETVPVTLTSISISIITPPVETIIQTSTQEIPLPPSTIVTVITVTPSTEISFSPLPSTSTTTTTTTVISIETMNPTTIFPPIITVSIPIGTIVEGGGEITIPSTIQEISTISIDSPTPVFSSVISTVIEYVPIISTIEATATIFETVEFPITQLATIILPTTLEQIATQVATQIVGSTIFETVAQTINSIVTQVDTITEQVILTQTIQQVNTITEFQTIIPTIEGPPLVLTRTMTFSLSRNFFAIPTSSCVCPPPQVLTITKTVMDSRHNLFAGNASPPFAAQTSEIMPSLIFPPLPLPSSTTCITTSCSEGSSSSVTCEPRVLVVSICSEGSRKCHGDNMICLCINGQWDTPKLLDNHENEACIPMGEHDVHIISRRYQNYYNY